MARQLSREIIYILFIITWLPTLGIQASSNRDSWQQPQRIIDSIGVKTGMKIGEIGAGEGYFTFHMSETVGKTGRIYANDIARRKLLEIEERCESENVQNITTVLGETTDPKFPDDRLDMIIMVYVFHHLDEPITLFQNTKKYLKSRGMLIIVERDPEKYPASRGHFKDKTEILNTLKSTDFKLFKILDFLPRDNVYLYRLSDE